MMVVVVMAVMMLLDELHNGARVGRNRWKHGNAERPQHQNNQQLTHNTLPK
jgi:hypothetical protein